MSDYEMAYLAGVLAAFAIFIVTLAGVQIAESRAARERDARPDALTHYGTAFNPAE